MKWLNAGRSELVRLQEGNFPLNRDLVTDGDLLAGLTRRNSRYDRQIVVIFRPVTVHVRPQRLRIGPFGESLLPLFRELVVSQSGLDFGSN